MANPQGTAAHYLYTKERQRPFASRLTSRSSSMSHLLPIKILFTATSACCDGKRGVVGCKGSEENKGGLSSAAKRPSDAMRSSTATTRAGSGSTHETQPPTRAVLEGSNSPRACAFRERERRQPQHQVAAHQNIPSNATIDDDMHISPQTHNTRIVGMDVFVGSIRDTYTLPPTHTSLNRRVPTGGRGEGI